MVMGTFNKKGSGSFLDPYSPDWTTAPGGPLGYVPTIWAVTGETVDTFTVLYLAQ